MSELLWLITLHLLLLASTTAKEPELPLCPTSVPYFPQSLPMHCRMPSKSDLPNSNNAITLPPGYVQNPPSDKQPPMPIGMPGFQGMPGISMPGMPMPMPMPMPIGVPGPPPMPGQKLPVIVMPFYRPDNSDIRRPPKRPKPRPHYSRETDGSSDTSSDNGRDTNADSDADTDNSNGSSDSGGFWKERARQRQTRRSGSAFRQRHNRKQHRRKKQRKHLLTPVLQYVTKDGYVVFEKKISKGEAKDWLKLSKNTATGNTANDNGETPKEWERFQMNEEDDAVVETKQEKVKAKKNILKPKTRRPSYNKVSHSEDKRQEI